MTWLLARVGHKFLLYSTLALLATNFGSAFLVKRYFAKYSQAVIQCNLEIETSALLARELVEKRLRKAYEDEIAALEERVAAEAAAASQAKQEAYQAEKRRERAQSQYEEALNEPVTQEWASAPLPDSVRRLLDTANGS